MVHPKNHASRAPKSPAPVKGEQKQTNGSGSRSRQLPARPAATDHAAWNGYWQARKQPWRLEPEISPQRQDELKRHRTIIPAIEKGIYPFRGMKLDRADVEWLVATDEAAQESMNLALEGNERAGLDVRGADLRQADLSYLPLMHLRGGLAFEEWYAATEEQRAMAVVLMGGISLSGARLEGANLSGAQLQEANLNEAQLEGANLSEAQLQGAGLIEAQLEGANLSGALLQGAGLIGAQLQRTNLFRAQLQGADLRGAQLQRANLNGAQLQGANLSEAQLQGADLFRAQLERVSLYRARLEGANLSEAQLQNVNLSEAQLQGVDFRGAQLQRTNLKDATLRDNQGVGPRLVDVQWGDTNLGVVDWSQVAMLGDECQAWQRRTQDGEKKDKIARLDEFRIAVRANRQLVVALQTQGLNEDAVRFAHRAQILQRSVLRRQKRYGPYFFSGFLDLIAGYGYKPGRSLLWYLVIITGFSVGYYLVTHTLHAQPYPLAWYEALILSISSFHGRGFFQPVKNLGDPVAILASIEAVVGLIIEISFIATFTQRYFGK